MQKNKQKMDNLFSAESFDAINKGDHVIIIGRDELKGLIGIIVGINSHASLPECIFSVELEANGHIIQRKKKNLKRYFLPVN
jgi:preprotein translocase subunit YajC